MRELVLTPAAMGESSRKNKANRELRWVKRQCWRNKEGDRRRWGERRRELVMMLVYFVIPRWKRFISCLGQHREETMTVFCLVVALLFCSLTFTSITSFILYTHLLFIYLYLVSFVTEAERVASSSDERQRLSPMWKLVFLSSIQYR